MDTKKLDKWADLLLDTGKRNNLINFKDTRASTVEVLLPSSDVLFEKVDGTASFEVFDPKIVEEDDDTEESYAPEQLQIGAPEESSEPEQLQIAVSEKTDASGGKAAFLAQYSGKIKRQNQILLYNAATNPLTAVKNIDKKAREFIEETGVNVAYMAFGFVHWKEGAASNYVFRAPILLVPIRLEQASAVEPYFIKSAEDDIIVNPTFSYKMDAEHGVKLPEYNDEGLTAYLEKVKRLVAKLQWTVTDECKIGIFSFLKINMYRDLKDNAKAILANQNVRQLLGEPTSTEKLYGDEGTAGSVIDPLIELHSVVDADSSQIEAIEMAKSGKSFVLQGPPGTGKSQTITNIIAECLSDGKKVLFVSEKLAALNVVYDKLKQAGLAEFCLQLHSHKANKKDVIADICHTLRAGKSAVSSKADAEIAIKEKAQHQLDAYAVELHKLNPVIEKSLYQLYESYAAFRSTPDVEFPIPQLASKGESYLIETAALLEQYADYIPSIGYDYRKNPWYGYINQDTSYQSKNKVKSDLSAVSQFLQTLIPLQQKISEKYEIQCTSVEDAQLWNSFFGFAATSKLITPSLLNRERFDAVNSALHKLQGQSADIMAARSVLGAVFDDDIYKLDGAAYHKKLTKQFGGIFSRLFNAEYKQLITDLRLCKKDGKKPAYNEAVSMTERLAYVLAIECDGATYHSSKNARDRDRLRQEILERMGWKFYRIWSTDWFRNKSVEQLRLLEAAADAVKNPTKAEAKPVDGQPTETFEEVAVEKHFEFPAYKAADFFKVCRHHDYSDFKAIVKEILEVEAPLSEDLFLKRIVWYFEREKVTNVVQRAYEQQMYGYQRYGIIRRNGFLYLDNGKEIQFRGPGDIERDIKQIAPEELAAGMFEILKQNVTADKSGLYRSLAAQCGVTRVGKAINEAMDAALSILADKVSVSGEAISVRQ